MSSNTCFLQDFHIGETVYKRGSPCDDLELAVIEELHNWGVVRIEGRADVQRLPGETVLKVHNAKLSTRGVI